ncbi:MAG: D-glycerate dehydrogenase [Acidobacteria bacterium]|jgi:glyoxylate reductase|nr:D-glycerate dehydrogenase [Acidobacteriota bacterium]
MGKPFRIFATTDIGKEALDRLREKGWEVEVYDHLPAPPKRVILEKVRSGIDALITTLRDKIDREVFAAGSAAGLKVVAQDAVGFDNIDREAANRHRIPFTNTPEVLTDATAEFAFFMLGAVARKLYPAEVQVREGKWTTWHPYLPWLGDEVSGRTLAVIGMGHIGKSVVNKAMGFDMDILCHDPTYEEHSFIEAIRWFMEVRHRERLSRRLQTIEYVSLDDALRRADFVSLHVPLTLPGTAEEPTHHLINEERLRLMKRTAYLVNTSRGPVVDEQALARALREGEIAGAALDVFETEPLPADSPLRDEKLCGKLRLFPHAASAARATRLSPDPNVGMAGRCVQAVIDVLDGNHDGDPRQMPFVVNKEAFS